MELTDILSVSGMSGLYRVISQRRDGLIIRALDGSETKFAPTRKHGFSPLETIAIYTNTDTIELKEVFKKMMGSETSIPKNLDDSVALKDYFAQVIEDYDPDRVRVSDIKKVIKWFTILKEQDLLTSSEEEE